MMLRYFVPRMDAPINPTANPPANPPQKRWAPPFTKENAKEFARRSHEVRRLKSQEAAVHRRLMNNAMQIMEDAARIEVSDPKDSFAEDSLARCRSEISSLWKSFHKAVASGSSRPIESLSKSIATLARLEQVLAGRPSPGSRRPPPAERETTSRNRRMASVYDEQPNNVPRGTIQTQQPNQGTANPSATTKQGEESNAPG